MRMKQREILNLLSPRFAGDHQIRREFLISTIEDIQGRAREILSKHAKTGYSLIFRNDVESYVAALLLADANIRLHLVVVDGNAGAIREAQEIERRFENVTLDILDLHALFLAFYHVRRESITFDPNQPFYRTRLLMALQYALSNDLLTAGTLTQERCLLGLFEKNGEAFCDFHPLLQLIPEDVFEIASMVGLSQESHSLDDPVKEEYHLTHRVVNDYLKGFDLEKKAMLKIASAFDKKRHLLPHLLPAAPTTAYTHVVIDTTHAFIDGALACNNAQSAVLHSAQFIEAHPHHRVLYVRDKHPANHCSFKENGGIWPAHAVEGTRECLFADAYYELTKKINTPLECYNIFNKGSDPSLEEYSGFCAYNRDSQLRFNLTKEIIISGIATEYCVKNTVMDLLKNGFSVTVLKDGLAYVEEAGHLEALVQMQSAGATII